MEPASIPESQKQLTVPRRNVEVVLAEVGEKPLVATMPPIEDILEMSELGAAHFSLSSAISDDGPEKWVREELVSLKNKSERFSHSSTFLTRLAMLSRLAGDRAAERAYLRNAADVDKGRYFAHRLADERLEHGEVSEAEALFKQMDLKDDAYANLRLAFFCVQRNEIAGAEHHVEMALECDPFDYRARLFEGGLRLVRGEFNKAILSFRIAAEENPTSSVVFANMSIAYVGARQFDKAFVSLRRAVALDPLNLRAVALFADLAAFKKQSVDALPSLRYFLEYEQKSEQMWARLARASLEVGLVEETIDALKRQGGVEQTSEVWNNLGVAYEKNKKAEKALRAFLYAMDIAEPHSRSYFVAARNVAQFYCDRDKLPVLSKGAVVEFIDRVLLQDTRRIVAKEPFASDLYVFKIMTLSQLKRHDEAIDAGLKVLSQSEVAERLVVWIVGDLVARFAVAGRVTEIIPLLEDYSDYLRELKSTDPQRRELFFNNFAFALAELGRTEEARHALSFIAPSIRKSAYPTATLGLINLRSGKIDRGIELYKAAIRLPGPKGQKNRIRQKLYLELAKYLENSEPTRAGRLLERVARERYGEDFLAEEAERLLSVRRLRGMEQ